MVLSIFFMLLCGEIMCFVYGGQDGKGAPPEIWHWCVVIVVSVLTAYIVSKLLVGRIGRLTKMQDNPEKT